MSNSNTTAAAVSVENFINEVENAKIQVESELYDTDQANMQYKGFSHTMTVCGVELQYFGDGSDVVNIDNLNVIDENGKRLSSEKIEAVLYEHSDFMDVPNNVDVVNYTQFDEEDYENIDIIYDQNNQVVGLLECESGNELSWNTISWGGVNEPKNGLCDIEYRGEQQNIGVEHNAKKAFELETEDPEIQRFNVFHGVIVTKEFMDEVNEKREKIARAQRAAAGAAPVGTSTAAQAAGTPTTAPKM